MSSDSAVISIDSFVAADAFFSDESIVIAEFRVLADILVVD
jgi:hypothetical protein